VASTTRYFDTLAGTFYPVVLSHAAGDTLWKREFDPDPTYDTGNPQANQQQQGILNSLSLTSDGEGWGIGDFGPSVTANSTRDGRRPSGKRRSATPPSRRRSGSASRRTVRTSRR